MLWVEYTPETKARTRSFLYYVLDIRTHIHSSGLRISRRVSIAHKLYVLAPIHQHAHYSAARDAQKFNSMRG
jgi:hypothetical protein